MNLKNLQSKFLERHMAYSTVLWRASRLVSKRYTKITIYEHMTTTVYSWLNYVSWLWTLSDTSISLIIFREYNKAELDPRAVNCNIVSYVIKIKQ